MNDYNMQVAQAAATGQPQPTLPAGFFLAFAPVWLIMMLAFVAVFCAVVRAIAWGGHDRLAVLRFGMDEFRLIGLGILAFVMLFVGVIVVGVVMALIGGVIAWLAGGTSTVAAGLIAVVMVLGLFALMIWLNVRLSLIAPITVLRGKISIGDGWRATRGHFWALFGTFVVLWICFMLIWLAFMAISQPQLVAAILHGFDRAEIEAANAAQMAQFGDGITFKLVLNWIISIPMSMLFNAVWFGAIATAAVDLSHGEPVAPVDHMN